MKREDLYTTLLDQQKDFEEENPSVKRSLSNEITEIFPLKMPIIITGVRRCGKSFLLKLIKESMGLKDKSYLYVNFNDERFANFSVDDFQRILDFMTEQKYEEKSFLFLDEIQEAEEWEKWIDRIKKRYSIVITGSNSKLLSSEISSVLTGRSINLNLMPFDFHEFLAAKQIRISEQDFNTKQLAILRTNFREFLVSGGMPQRVVTGNEIVVRELYENILYRDIIKRFGKLSREIREISLYLLSNPSSKISTRTISEFSGIKNLSTIKKVLELFENAFLFFFVNKIGYSVKKQIQNPRKVYCVDNGFLTTVGFRLSEDKGKLLENLVAIELKRRRREFFYYSEKKECDFVIRTGNRITEVIQVCYELNKENEEREIGGLIETMETYELKDGLILTFDNERKIKIKNKKITVIPLWKWLLEKQDKK